MFPRLLVSRPSSSSGVTYVRNTPRPYVGGDRDLLTGSLSFRGISEHETDIPGRWVMSISYRLVEPTLWATRRWNGNRCTDHVFVLSKGLICNPCYGFQRQHAWYVPIPQRSTSYQWTETGSFEESTKARWYPAGYYLYRQRNTLYLP